MHTDEAMRRIRAIAPILKALGVASVYLFGSTARGDAQPTSDVDIFIDKDPARPFGMTEFCRIKDSLDEALGAEVDLATRSSLHPAMRADIERTAIRVL